MGNITPREKILTNIADNCIKVVKIEMTQPLSMDQTMQFRIHLEILNPSLTDEDFKIFLAILKDELNQGLEEVLRNDIFLV